MDNVDRPLGLFNKPPEEIAESLASNEGSFQGSAAGMRLLTFYISHAAGRLSPSKIRRLEKARKLLAARMLREIRGKDAA